MSSSEPPSRVPPRQQPHETKAAREELFSKDKVEKIREVGDEETRKKKFLKYYQGEANEEEQSHPSPHDLYSGKLTTTPTAGGGLSLGDDVENAIVPSPPYTPPPNVNASFEGEDEATEEALPQSKSFWKEVDLPDQPTPSTHLQENPDLSKKASPGTTKSKGALPFATPEVPKATLPPAKKKEVAPSPFGLPDKLPKPKKEAPVQRGPFEKTPAAIRPTSAEEHEVQPKLAPPSKTPPRQQPTAPPPKKDKLPIRESKHPRVEKSPPSEEPIAPALAQPEKREPFEKEKREEGVEIEAISLPTIPQEIQPIIATATAQAAPYLNPSTIPLFFQMVGTMYVMASPPGISRTEIVLNNPIYANSKFYGSTIRIEKYATAPDSFNITLTGSHEAVAAFKENAPSLMTAFENGNFAFRVNRLDVEYSLEKPIFHRKEKSSGKGEGDLGEGKK